MISFAVVSVACLLFVEASLRTNLIADIRDSTSTTREAFGTLSSKDASDHDKELAARKAAAKLSGAALRFIFKIVAIVAILAVVIWSLTLIIPGLASAVTADLTSVGKLAAFTAFSIAYVLARNAITART